MPIDFSKFDDQQQGSEFGPAEEEAIVSLILDYPETFVPLAKFVTSELFSGLAPKYIIEMLKQEFEKYGSVPSRPLFRDKVAKTLDVDDPYEEILGLVERKSDPRDVARIRDRIHDWVKHQTLGLLYSDQALDAHVRGDYEYLEGIFNDATRISVSGDQGLWFFDQIEELLADNVLEHIDIGFPQLNTALNEGGPSPGEVLVWLAPTGVGKTLMMCNNAAKIVSRGHNVLLVTFELSKMKTALRIASGMSGVKLNSFYKPNVEKLSDYELSSLRLEQDKVRTTLQTRAKFGKDGVERGDLVIYELPPDECSVNEIYGIIERVRKMKGWQPKVVIIDYLELMMSRHSHSNKEGDYTRQKSVATEVRGLAGNENVLVITANQTNRQGVKAGDESGPIDVDKSAESFGKNMPVDYVVSLNQTRDEYNNGMIRFWVAKNRNGPKFVSITASIKYETMQIMEVH